MLDLKNKELNKKIKLVVTVLFALFIICNSIWGIIKFGTLNDSISILLIKFLPGMLGSWIIFRKFKDKDGLKFALGTIFSIIMYYVFCNLLLIIFLLISTIIVCFE